MGEYRRLWFKDKEREVVHLKKAGSYSGLTRNGAFTVFGIVIRTRSFLGDVRIIQ